MQRPVNACDAYRLRSPFPSAPLGCSPSSCIVPSRPESLLLIRAWMISFKIRNMLHPSCFGSGRCYLRVRPLSCSISPMRAATSPSKNPNFFIAQLPSFLSVSKSYPLTAGATLELLQLAHACCYQSFKKSELLHCPVSLLSACIECL